MANISVVSVGKTYSVVLDAILLPLGWWEPPRGVVTALKSRAHTWAVFQKSAKHEHVAPRDFKNIIPSCLDQKIAEDFNYNNGI